MAYDRQAALTYTMFYWNKVCHDGRVATSSRYARIPAGTPMNDSSRPLQLGGDDEDDCTHFMSCCIGWKGNLPGTADGKPVPAGGGLTLPQPWLATAGVFGVDSVAVLRDYLIAHRYASEIGPTYWDKDNDLKGTAAAIAANLKSGDLVAYSNGNDPKNVDRKTNKDGTTFRHCTMIVGATTIRSFGETFQIPTIACHTIPRYDVDFRDVHLQYVTLLKIIA